MDNNEISALIIKIYDEQKKTSSKIDNMGNLIVELQDRNTSANRWFTRTSKWT